MNKMPRYSFSGHESFPFRFTWLPKGVQAARKMPDIFTRIDAPVLLGVGKNMVYSIRHWCMAMGLLEPDGKSGRVKVTPLGHSLFSLSGWDPYLEDVGTVWLLHWLLVRQEHLASTWHLAFSRWNEPYFDRQRLVEWLEGIAAQSPNVRATTSSIERDVEVFIRSYVPSRLSKSSSIEDAFDCPLVELGLIDEVERNVYRFTRGYRTSLPTEILVYIILDYWQRQAPEQNSISFDKLQFWPGGPGAALKLSEEALAGQLELLPDWTGLRYDETAGIRVLFRTAAAFKDGDDAINILARYYGQSTSGVA